MPAIRSLLRRAAFARFGQASQVGGVPPVVPPAVIVVDGSGNPVVDGSGNQVVP